jgi:hypothetical protein
LLQDRKYSHIPLRERQAAMIEVEKLKRYLAGCGGVAEKGAEEPAAGDFAGGGAEGGGEGEGGGRDGSDEGEGGYEYEEDGVWDEEEDGDLA